MASVIEKLRKVIDGVTNDLYPVTHTNAVRYPDASTLTTKLGIPEDGSMSSLTTTARTLVGGINEVKGTADGAADGANYTSDEIDALYTAAEG